MSEEEVVPQQRPMVTDIAIGESQRFAEFLLQNVPEIEAISVTVSWRPPLSNLPSVVIKGRQGGLSTPGEAVRMLEQLLIGIRYLHSQIDGALHQADELMAQRAESIRKQEEEIEHNRDIIDKLLRERYAVSCVPIPDDDGK